VVLQVFQKVGLSGFLAHEVTVEGSGLPAKNIGLLLVVVSLQVCEEARGHVCMFGSRSQCGEERCTGQLVEPPGDQPAGEDDQSKVGQKECDTLARALDLNRVQVHVELGSEVRVQDTVDVLEVGTS
jgi:hypothetical protein